MSKGGQQQPSGQNSMDILYISAFFVLLAIGLWYSQHAFIVRIIYQLKIHEISLILSVAHFLSESIIPFINQHLGDFLSKYNLVIEPFNYNFLTELQASMLSVDYEKVTIYDLWFKMNQVGAYFIYPGIVICVLMMIYLNLFSLGSKFNMVFDMQSLRKKDSKLWPFITPVLHTNLIDTDLDKEPYRMAQRPKEFAEKHKILEYPRENGRPVMKVNKSKAMLCFSMQMGPIWSGIDSLPPYAQALFAIFSAKAEKDGKSAEALLKQIASSAVENQKLDFSGSRELLVKHVRNSKVIGRAISPHAYMLTVMASMLEAARQDGVIACAEFLWLKTIDSSLWYMLNSVGRQTPFPEVSGPFAHFRVEKRLRRPLRVPMVKEAVDALVIAIAEIKYNPDGY
jgi:intracellular multiplication protein IcmP